MYAAEQRKEREFLEETIHSIQLESELTSRALKQTITVSHLAWLAVQRQFVHVWRGMSLCPFNKGCAMHPATASLPTQ